jgi:hypothetical protein
MYFPTTLLLIGAACLVLGLVCADADGADDDDGHGVAVIVLIVLGLAILWRVA